MRQMTCSVLNSQFTFFFLHSSLLNEQKKREKVWYNQMCPSNKIQYYMVLVYVYILHSIRIISKHHIWVVLCVLIVWIAYFGNVFYIDWLLVISCHSHFFWIGWCMSVCIYIYIEVNTFAVPHIFWIRVRFT